MQVKTGSGNKGLDWVIIAGMVAAFPKTADLLSYWSPAFLNEIFGFDVSLFYGAFCAAMVEGTILFLHFDRRAHRAVSAQWVKWILILISFACQVFDGYITTETVSQMSDSLKAVMTIGIPALPLIIAVMVASIGALPDDEDEQPQKPRKGLKKAIRELLDGDEVVQTNQTKVVGQFKELPKSPNGEHEESFQSRQSR
jgi:hypothetical protein